MKNLYFLIATILLIGFTACNNDDDNSSTQTLIGKWKFEQQGYLINGQEILEPYENDCPTKFDHVEFLNNGITKDFYYGVDCREYVDNGTWSQSGNMLSLLFEDFQTQVEILSLTNSSLKVKTIDEDNMVNISILSRM
ncbi:MAG: lipocalin family protein [Flavobacteriaceae bacterium]|nr:lipocalin family protein [Flavobacteriaceae bacterium]